MSISHNTIIFFVAIKSSTRIPLPHQNQQDTDIFFLHLFEESNANSNCTESWLALCQDQFNENSLQICPEVLELQSCLKACVNNIWPSYAAIRLKYESLVDKMNSYPDCLPPSKGTHFFLY